MNQHANDPFLMAPYPRRILLQALGLMWSCGDAGLVHADPSNPSQGHHKPSIQGAEVGKDEVRRSLQNYPLPQVWVLDQNGNKARFDRCIDDDRTVILNFIFTSCGAICPVMTQIFAQVQDRLGSSAERVHMVSVSIDPQFDTPGRLLAYAKEYRAGPQWDFYTGSSEASMAVQKAFDAYRGDKMNHTPLTLLRAAAAKQWVRLDGFASAKRIVQECRALTK